MKLKLCYVMRDQAARLFICNLASKQGKADFKYDFSVPHPGFNDHVFSHVETKRWYRIQGNYCVIVYEQA